MISNVEIFDLSVWRYSKLPAALIPLNKQYNYELRKLWLKDILRDHEITNQLSLLYGKNGHLLLNSSLKLVEDDDTEKSKSVEKRLDYLAQLLISLAYRNDTGKKGSLSLVSLGKQSKVLREQVEVLYPDRSEGDTDSLGKQRKVLREQVEVLYPDRSKGDPDSLKKLAEMHNKEVNFLERQALKRKLLDAKSNSYFRFSLGLSQRLELNRHELTEIKKNHKLIGELLCELLHNDYDTYLIPFCVDYLLGKSGPLVMEIHCPPRTIEVMYYGFRPFFPKLEFPSDLLMSRLVESYYNKEGAYPRSIIFYCPLPDTAFFQIEANRFILNSRNLGLEEIYLAKNLAEGYPVNGGVINFGGTFTTVEIIFFMDLIDGMIITSPKGPTVVPPCKIFNLVGDRKLLKTKLEDLNIPIPKSVFLRRGSCLDFEDIGNQIGNWVVMKPRLNEPWWSPTKIRVQFLSLQDSLHRDRLAKMISKNDLFLEEFVTDSLDKHGTFGELRVYGVAGPIMETVS